MNIEIDFHVLSVCSSCTRNLNMIRMKTSYHIMHLWLIKEKKKKRPKIYNLVLNLNIFLILQIVRSNYFYDRKIDF